MLTPLKIAKLYNIYGVRIEDFHLYSIATLDVFTYFPYPDKIYELLIALTDTHENKPAFVYIYPDSGASGLVRNGYYPTPHLHDLTLISNNGILDVERETNG